MQGPTLGGLKASLLEISTTRAEEFTKRYTSAIACTVHTPDNHTRKQIFVHSVGHGMFAHKNLAQSSGC